MLTDRTVWEDLCIEYEKMKDEPEEVLELLRKLCGFVVFEADLRH
jgi:hypothetical protein